MNQMQGLHIKCSIEQHELLELACLNKLCKANRVYCHQCIKNGDHIAHPKDQKNLIELIQFFQKIEQESEQLISKLCFMVEEIKGLTIELNQELRKKYQFSKERLQQLNAKQLNQALDQIIKFDEIKIVLLNELETSSDNMVIFEITLKLRYYQKDNTQTIEPLNNDQLNKQQQEMVEELYNKGYKLFLIIKSIQSYIVRISNMRKQQKCQMLHYSLIKIIYNHQIQKVQNHNVNVLAWCLKQLLRLLLNIRILRNYKDAIICADKVLSIDSKHFNSLDIKATCLNNYNDAIIWADKALSIDSKNFTSFQVKGDSLYSINNNKNYSQWVNMRKLLRFVIQH